MARRAAPKKRSTKKSAPKKKAPAKTEATPRRRELLGILCLSSGLTLLLALASFSPADDARLAEGLRVTHNLIGAVGHHVADALFTTIGLGSFVLALALIVVAFALFARRAVHVSMVEILGYGSLMLFGAILAHLALPHARPFAHSPGGVVGLVLGELLRSELNTVGAAIVALAGVLVSLVVATDLTLAHLGGLAAGGLRGLARRGVVVARIHWARRRDARGRRAEARAALAAERARTKTERAKDQAARAEAAIPPAVTTDEAGIVRVTFAETPVDPAPPPPAPVASEAAAIAPLDEVEAMCDVEPVDPLADPTHADPDWAPSLAGMAAGDAEAEAAEADPAEGAAPEIVADPSPDAVEVAGAEADTPEAPAPPAHPTRPAEIAPADDAPAAAEMEPAPEGPAIVEARAPDRPRHKPRQDAFAFAQHGEAFVLPTLDLLDEPPEEAREAVDRTALHETAKKLTQKLADFGITGEVRKIRLGPVVTMYEFVPGPGVRISKIAGLSDDLAMAMEALQVRIVAPLPGKGAVGIEVPNKKRQTVHLKQIVDQDAFAEARSKLTLAMGKDVEGMPFMVDLAQMPHLLIAGTTGSGKSVSVNAMITSILMKATPADVRFIMVDPKVTELKLYDGIPHLLLPVVDDPAKAALALRWAVEEMERRYQLLADTSVRNLAGYNRVAEKRRAEWLARQETRTPPPPLETADGDHEAYLALKEAHERFILDDPPPPEKLPLVVIIIDELADLMMVASREVETYIARIAQKARAAGIHLMVATQRPSTDVLTGLIKANFPARIGFRVASRHDSQTIINGPGSEKLLGRGDMLIIPPGQSDPLRVHGAFVADDEIKRVVAHLKEQGQPIYDESILETRDDDGDGDDGGTPLEHDAKWDEALAIIADRDAISVSFLQRRLAIGYNRAARMIEMMERDGVVGPADGSKPRKVLLGAAPM